MMQQCQLFHSSVLFQLNALFMELFFFKQAVNLLSYTSFLMTHLWQPAKDQITFSNHVMLLLYARTSDDLLVEAVAKFYLLRGGRGGVRGCRKGPFQILLAAAA